MFTCSPCSSTESSKSICRDFRTSWLERFLLLRMTLRYDSTSSMGLVGGTGVVLVFLMLWGLWFQERYVRLGGLFFAPGWFLVEHPILWQMKHLLIRMCSAR